MIRSRRLQRHDVRQLRSAEGGASQHPGARPALATVDGDRALRTSAPKGLARRGSASLAGSAVASVGQLLMTIVVARALIPTDAGLFFSATSLFLLVTAAAKLGTPTGLVWALSGQRARNEDELLVPTIRVALLPVVVVGVTSGLVLFLAADALAPLLVASSPGGAADGMPALLRALAVFVPISALYDAVCAATRGAGSMRPTLAVERLFRPLVQCGLVFAIAWSASTFWVTLAWAVPYGVSLYLVVMMMRAQLRRYPRRDHTVHAPRALRAAFWKFTLPRAISGLAQTVLQRLDIVLIGAIRGPRDAAIYAAATRFLVLGQTAGLAISLAVQPNLGEELGRQDQVAAGTIYRMSTAWLIIVTWPLYLFSIIAPNLVLSIFGHGYQTGAGVIRILSAAMLISTGCGMVDMVLNMAGRTWWNLANVSLSALVFVGLDLLLIPTWGITGAAVGWACAILINNLLPLAQIGLSLRLHPFGRATAMACVWAGLACFALPEALLLAIPAGHDLLTLGVLIASGLVYSAGLYVRRVDFGIDRLLSRRGSGEPAHFAVQSSPETDRSPATGLSALDSALDDVALGRTALDSVLDDVALNEAVLGDGALRTTGREGWAVPLGRHATHRRGSRGARARNRPAGPRHRRA